METQNRNIQGIGEYSKMRMKTDSINVLLIDDDPLFIDLMKHAASKKNIHLTCCSTLSEISVVVLGRVFDVVLLDQYLDGCQEKLKGSEIASLLKDVPIVMVSSSADERSNTKLKENLNAPVELFAPKSIGPSALLDIALIEGKSNKLKQLAMRS